MKGKRILAITLCFCLATVLCPAADRVTQPLRTYGLGDLLQAAISPDGRWLATSGSSGAFIWDFQSGTLRHRLEGNRGSVTTLCFSPDNRVLLTGGNDAVIEAWAVESGTKLRSFEGHRNSIAGLVFSPGRQNFVSAAEDGARVWSLETGQLLHTFKEPGAFITRALFTPDGNRLVTADVTFDGSLDNIKLWDVASEQVIRRFGDQAVTLAFVAGGHLVAGGQNATVRVWDIETGQPIRSLVGATLFVVDLVASTNSSRVVAGCVDGRVITWDASTGAVLNNFLGEPLGAINAIPGTNQVLTAHAGDNLVRVKDLGTGTTLRIIEGHTTSTTRGVAFSPDGRYVLSGGSEPLTRLWNRTNAAPVRTFPGHGAGTVTASFSPDGAQILTTRGIPHVAQLWNTQTGLLEREFIGHASWLTAAAFSSDGRRIATGAQDGTARLWDVATGAQIRSFNTPGSIVTSVAISSNGMVLVSGTSDGVVRLWNTNGTLLRSFSLEFNSQVSRLAFSPATGELLVAWADGVLRTFDPTTGALKLGSIFPQGFLFTAAFSPDGRFILEAEGWPSFTARLWDARTGEELRNFFAGTAAEVRSVAFNAAGTSILTGSDRVRLWSIADIAARLETERKPDGVELRSSLGTLQSSTRVDGPWVDVTNAVSPWPIATDQASAFFRVRVTPDQ